jgi:phenol 2-monooxygenase
VILDTYDTERGLVARKLLDADRTCLDLFATPFGSETSSILERAEELMKFLAGRGICYSDPLLTSPSVKGMGVLKPGENLPEQSITNHATGRAVSLHNTIKTDGSWCLIVYAGDVSCPSQLLRIHKWAAEYEAAQKDPWLKLFGLLDSFLVHCAPWNEINLADLPAIFLPMHQMTGRVYEKICLDEGTIYEEAALDRMNGGVVLVRPDHHIGWVGTLDDFDFLEQYLSSISQDGAKIQDT